MDIGNFEGFITEKEVNIGVFEIDVIWKKPPVTNDPFIAFEVVTTTEPTNALSSLKTARSTWNCQVLVIVAEGDKEIRSRQLLETTFFDISEYTKIINFSTIQQLHEHLLELNPLKDNIGYKTVPKQ